MARTCLHCGRLTATLARCECRRQPYGTTTYRRNRKAILARRPPCALCGFPGADTVDHRIPISQGGSSDLSNLQPLHRTCNSSKGNRG